jgi:hypothetical protein
MGIKIGQATVRDPWEWRKTVLDAKSYNGLYCFIRRMRKWRRRRIQMRNTLYHFQLSYAFCNAAYIHI